MNPRLLPERIKHHQQKQLSIISLFGFQSLATLLPGFKGVGKHDLDDSKVLGPQTRTVMKRTAHTLPSSSKEEASTKPELMSEKTREAVIWHVKKCSNERSCAICSYLKQMKSWSDATSVKLNNTILGSWLLLGWILTSKRLACLAP